MGVHEPAVPHHVLGSPSSPGKTGYPVMPVSEGLRGWEHTASQPFTTSSYDSWISNRSDCIPVKLTRPPFTTGTC